MPATMRAVRLNGPGPAESLVVTDVPRPVPRPGWILIRVKAFGLNRSELHLRQGVAGNARFPVIPGIEATGIVEEAPGGEFEPGTTVMAMMGGMGRSFDGGYAEFASVPARQVVPFTSTLDWPLLGAVPEMLQTAHGSLAIGTGLVRGQTLLIRGGTSSVGMAAAVLAHRAGVRVISTTRRQGMEAALRRLGVDEVVLDDGAIADRVRDLAPGGVDGAIELVGVNVLRDTLAATRSGGTVCFTGMLSDEWTIPQFYPMDWLPNGVRLTAYSGDAGDLPPAVLDDYLQAVAAGEAEIPVGTVYGLDDIALAHRDLEENRKPGKLVVIP